MVCEPSRHITASLALDRLESYVPHMNGAVVGIATLFALIMARSESDARIAPGSRDVEIVAHDYTFIAPTELAAGEVTFRFRNEGKVIHELDVALLKDGATAGAVMSALNARTPLKPLIETAMGILIARPRHRSSVGLSTGLLPGRDYLVICRLQDSSSTPMHSRMGMVAVIHIAAAGIAAIPIARADTITGLDYAFRAPSTLMPGKHTLVFVNSGKVLHEVNIALLRRGVTARQMLRALSSNQDANPFVEEWLGVLFAGPGGSASGRLQVALLPDREYVISCGLPMTDRDDAPMHLTAGMSGSIRTTRMVRRP